MTGAPVAVATHIDAVAGTVLRQRRRDPLFPHQHGAWAFLVLPVVLALPVSGISWAWTLLSIGWVAAYPTSWALTGLLAGPRPERFHRAARLWLPPTTALAVALVWLRPWLVVVGAGFVVLFCLHLTYARRRDERALANDLLLVVECAVMVPVTVGVVAGERSWIPPDLAWSASSLGLALVCLLALTGSVLHVKSRIRERRNLRYAVAAQAYAVACVPAVAVVGIAAGTSTWLVIPFTLMAVRVRLVPQGWRPSRVGLVELACFVVLVATAFTA